MSKCTNRQGFYLRCLTGVDTRPTGLTFEKASEFISTAKAGDVATIRARLLMMGGIDKGQPKAAKPKLDCEAIYKEAREAGLKAGIAHNPQPMAVTAHANPLDDNSEVTEAWLVNDGVCGFAWVNTPGNKAFGKWMKKTGVGRADSYYGGITMWVGDHGQSYERKCAHAAAFCKVLESHGIKAYVGSRLD